MAEETANDESGASALALRLDAAATREELEFAEPTADEELKEQAREHADKLLAFDSGDSRAMEASRASVELMGRDLQRKAATRSQMLQQPVKELSRATEDGGPVAKSLVDLRVQVEDLDPAKLDLSPGWFTRLIGHIPGVGTPLKRYFMKFESSQTVIDSIIKSLEGGRDQLKRDNVTLTEDQHAMRGLTVQLTRQSSLAQGLDEVIQYKLEREIPDDDPRRRFVEEEILFTLRQRGMDLQQQLAVNQQGVLATEIIIRNNRELVRGVDRALDVTVSALQVAITVALALAHQKIVLDKIEAVNVTTSKLISDTAERLRQQGAEIHKKAAGTMLDMEALKSAFVDINTALEDIATYRREALPQMASTILELNELTTKGEKAMERMDEVRAAEPLLELDV